MKSGTRVSAVSDTSPEAERVLLELMRAKTAASRLMMVQDLNNTVRRLALTGLKNENEGATESTLLKLLASRLLGTLAEQVYKYHDGPISMNDELIDVTLRFISVLEQFDIPYLIGGSLAAAVYGTVRLTKDADLVVDLKTEHIKPLVACLEKDFYIDSESIAAAIRTNSSFNLIHYNSACKIDVFLPKNRPFDMMRFKNKRLNNLGTDPERSAFFSSAEDILLSKLEWFRLGNEVSEQQWLDILGIVKNQEARLDLKYLRMQAEGLKIGDLLEEAFKSIGTGDSK